MDKIEVVRQMDLFASLNDVERALISSAARLRVLETGDHVCREGEQGRTFYAVGRGALSVRRGNPPAEVAVLRSGHYFGEMSLLTGAPRSATVVALDRAEVLEFDRPAFMNLFANNVGIAQAISEVVATRQMELRQFAEDARLKAPPPSDSGAIFGRIRQLFGLD